MKIPAMIAGPILSSLSTCKKHAMHVEIIGGEHVASGCNEIDAEPILATRIMPCPWMSAEKEPVVCFPKNHASHEP
jgi:hypothetical protein